MAKVAVIGCTHAGVFATTSILQSHPDWEVHVFERNDTVSFLSCGIALWVGDHVSDPQKNVLQFTTRTCRCRRTRSHANRCYLGRC
nr:FAD/NAD(P)-binding oxidoreductase [Fannyhessea vaginae]